MKQQSPLFLALLLSTASSAAWAFSVSPQGVKHHSFSPRTFLASSLVSSDLTEQSSTPTVDVRRQYETFLWKHDLKDYNINYRAEGPIDGPPVLLVHGFGANVNHFRHQFPVLVEQGYRVYAVDLLGFGASDKPSDAKYSIELFVELLVEFVKTMNADKPWVIGGNSIGGLCSLSVAENLPELIQGVVLFNCSGGMSGFRYEDVPMWVRPILYFVQKVILGPHMGSGFFERFKSRENVEAILKQQGVYRDTANVDEELLQILLGPSEDEGAEDVFLKVFAGPPGPTPESILPSVQCPVLAIWGSHDPWTPVDRGMHPGTTFGQYTESFELHVISAGHCPHDECPSRVHSIMIPWMNQVQKRYNPQSE